MNVIDVKKRWKIPQLIFCHCLVLFLVGTFIWPPTVKIWEMIDRTFFTWINHTLIDHPFRQLLWASANHRWADWIEDVFILGFFIVYISRLQKDKRKRGFAEFLFSSLYIATILFFVNRVIFRENFIIYRDSPSLILPECFRLSEAISWMRIKIDSPRSFPGDHATTAILFAASYFFYAGKRLGSIAIIYATFLCIPRMIVGAHWLSDVIVGAGSIALITLSWAFCTPLHLYCIEAIESFFTLFKKAKNIWTHKKDIKS